MSERISREGAGVALAGALLDELDEFISGNRYDPKSIALLELATIAFTEAVADGDSQREAALYAQVRAALESFRLQDRNRAEELADWALNLASRVLRGALGMVGLALMVVFSGCALLEEPGSVRASEVKPLIDLVSDDYDQYVEADQGLSEGARGDKLRSTAILRDVFEKALGGN